MSGVFTYVIIGKTESEDPPEDSEMNPDTGFEIRSVAVRGRARYLSVTEDPHNIKSLQMSGEDTFCFFET